MKYIGYVNTAYYIEQLEAFVLSMKQMPCSFIYYDEKGNGQRQNWKLFISRLNSNDTAVLVSFDNAFCNFNEMMFFLKLCASKNIRIISLKDSLDTSDVFFPKVSTQNTLNVIASMTVTKGQAAFDDFQAELLSDKFHEKKLKKYRMVINMYNAGYSIKEIMSRTGYHGKSNIYRILHMFNVELEYPTMVRSKQPGVGYYAKSLIVYYMTKLRLSKKGFYLFNISLLIVGLIITGVGAANLLSGQVLSPHAMFKLWVVIIPFFFVAILALIWLLLDMISFIVNHYKSKKS